MDIKGEQILERVLLLLKLRDIKQKDFFDKINISKQAVARWKNGGFPSTEVLYAMAQELNVSIDWLVTGNGSNDEWEDSSVSKIVDRILKTIHDKNGLQERDPDFYSVLNNISSGTELHDWKDGKRYIDTVKLTKIADVLGVSVQFLITGEEISKETYNNYLGNKEGKYSAFYKHFDCLDTDNKQFAMTMVSKLHAAQRQESYEEQRFEEIRKENEAIVNGGIKH